MNKVFLIGRLTKDADIRVSGDTKVANFTIAVDRTFKNKDGEKETDFFPVVAWRKLAEITEKYTNKGSQVAIVGKLQQRYYTTSDGQNRTVIEILADELQLLDTKKKTAENQSESPTQGVMSGFDEVEIELPF